MDEPPIFHYTGNPVPDQAAYAEKSLDEQLDEAETRLARAKINARDGSGGGRQIDPKRVRAANLPRDPKYAEMEAALMKHTLRPVPENAWHDPFFHKLKALLQEIIVTEDAAVRLAHLDRSYEWFCANKAPPEEELNREGAQKAAPLTFSTFMQHDERLQERYSPNCIPGAATYVPPPKDGDLDERPAPDRPSSRSATPRAPHSARGPHSARAPSGRPPAGPRPFLNLAKMRATYDGERPSTPSTSAGQPSSRPATALSQRSGLTSARPGSARPGSARLSSRPGTALSSRPSEVDSLDARRPYTARERPAEAAEFVPMPMQPVRSPEEQMQLRWLARRHEDIVTRERELQQHQLLTEWGRRRAQAEEESMRAQEASRFTSVVLRRVDQPPPPEPDTTVDVSKPFEARQPAERVPEQRNLDLEKLRRFRRLNPHVFGRDPAEAPEADTSEGVPSLSPYDAFRGPNAPVSQFKQRGQEELPLQNISSIWTEKHAVAAELPGTEHITPTLEAMRRQQLIEVDRVKRAFGAHNVPCNAAVLERALVMPPQHMRPHVGIGGFVPRLLVNPFFDHDAGTKKKKKGGKKRRR